MFVFSGQIDRDCLRERDGWMDRGLEGRVEMLRKMEGSVQRLDEKGIDGQADGQVVRRRVWTCCGRYGEV